MSKDLVDKIYEVLEEVEDPELGIDIVNLGLVYEVNIDEEKNAVIKMTMTSMGCPMVGEIMTESQIRLESRVKELNSIKIDLVWSPPWSKDHMSRYAKIALGVHG
ncbi:metal-sulfur cluster assembly factor [Cytobacillus spongiae]|jgi:metal-sulfur cluster biosynthetic enzyme|uniref:metal-sulfur cluster assembly factor n=1 Tax=Cytobacillus spongiae TaxID=2901381 RepID=UPI001F41AEA1|nr:metal-sulfur cluster assembly factor [Cytobacillus spongiae]UII56361.1 metal-sulfur cluster assembly factor [Cytobacillus spongiae]